MYFEKRESSSSSSTSSSSQQDNRKRQRSPSHEIAAGEMTKFLMENECFGDTGVQDVRLRVYLKSLQGVRSALTVLKYGCGIAVGTDLVVGVWL